MIGLLVTCAVQKGRVALADVPEEFGHDWVAPKLQQVALLELGEAVLAMVEPCAQFRGRRYILAPKSERGGVLADAARPEAIHQDAHAVGRRGLLVDSLDRDRRHWWSPHAIEQGGLARRNARRPKRHLLRH